MPGAKLIVLPGVGHMPHHAAPDLVTAEIEALAAGLASSDPDAPIDGSGRRHVLLGDEGDAHHVGRPGRAEGDAGDDDDAVVQPAR